jgi:hypothetical protein
MSRWIANQVCLRPIRTADSNGRHRSRKTEGRSMGRSLVQVKQGRSNPLVGNCIARSLAEMTARSVMCRVIARRSSGCVRPWRAGIAKPRVGYLGCISRAGTSDFPVRRGSTDPIAAPTKLVRRNCRVAATGALRNRLHGRPLDNRATCNNDLRRSFTR